MLSRLAFRTPLLAHAAAGVSPLAGALAPTAVLRFYSNDSSSSSGARGPQGSGGGSRRPRGALSRMPSPVQRRAPGASASPRAGPDASAPFPRAGPSVGRPSASSGVPAGSGVARDRAAVVADYREMGLDLAENPLSAKKELNIQSLFARSRMHASFEAPEPAHEDSFFASMAPNVPVYLGGTRRLMEPSGRLITSHGVLLVRTIDPAILAMVDTLTTVDYQAEKTVQQVTTAIVAEDGARAHVVDVDEATGAVNSRTIVRLRGDPWRWRSAVSLTQVERAAMAEGERPPEDADPDDLTVGSVVVSRFRFGAHGMLSEKIFLTNGAKVMTVADDLKVISEAAYDAKVREMFEANLTEEQRLQLEFERNFDDSMTPEQIEGKLSEMGLAAPPEEQRKEAGPGREMWARRKNRGG